MPALLKPSDVFAREIEPAFDEYKAEPLSERRAKNVARAIDHHLDWTYEYYAHVDRGRLLGAAQLKEFRQAIFLRCPELRIMFDISDAAHHRFLTRKNIPRIVETATAAFVEQDSQLWVQNYGRPFLPAVAAAVAFWKRWPD